MTAPVIADVPFSRVIREATVDAHGSAQHSGFMADLFSGKVDRERYANFVAQQRFIYDAIEHAATALGADPVAAPFLDTRLTRIPAIDADLEFLTGQRRDHSPEPTPATAVYVAAIRDASRAPAGLIAHHYVRYMGDLSGGQHIAKVIAAKLALGPDGIRAFAFDIDDLDAFKTAYRESLDSAPWSTSERQEVLAEILRAYRLATDMLADL